MLVDSPLQEDIAQFVPTIDIRDIVELSMKWLSGILDSMTES